MKPSNIFHQIRNDIGSISEQNGSAAYEWFYTVLKNPKFVVAPMVDQSELEWRQLSRSYGAQLCYTPMFHAGLFSTNLKYRASKFTTLPSDRPLIVQFCANDASTFVSAAQHVEDCCDAVDLNLGCPQGIARRGHYGSFLQDEWSLIANIVSHAKSQLKVPITCKIRCFPDVEKTVAYAKMIESAGASLITVHGRTRNQKGQITGLADWRQIAAVRAALNIPVLANGNIQYFEDIDRCIGFTRVNGVMVSEGHLSNPGIFTGKPIPLWEPMEMYLSLCEKNEKEHNFPIDQGAVRAHLFRMGHAALAVYTDLRDHLGRVTKFSDMRTVVAELSSRLKRDADLAGWKETDMPLDFDNYYRNMPHWLCQPKFREKFPPDSFLFCQMQSEEQISSNDNILAKQTMCQ